MSDYGSLIIQVPGMVILCVIVLSFIKKQRATDELLIKLVDLMGRIEEHLDDIKDAK